MAPALGLTQQELSTAADHLDAVVQELLHHLLHRQELRAAIDQREQADADRRLQRAVLVDLVQDQVRVGAAFEFDDQPDGFAVAGGRFVADPRNAHDAFVLHQPANVLGKLVPRDLERHFADDDVRRFPFAFFNDVCACPQGHPRPLAQVTPDDPVATHDDAAGGEVRAGDDLDEVLKGEFRFVHQPDEAVANFAEVVRRDVGRHADRDAVGAVHQKVRELARQHERFTILAVVVVDEVNGVRFQVRKHFGGGGHQPRFGVTVGGGGQPRNRAEVTLAVNQLRAEHPILRHPHECGVDARVTVRVVALHRLADDARTLRRRRGRTESQVVHRHENAPLRRLQPVPHIGQRPAHHHRLRIREVAVPQFVHDIEAVDGG